jgi:hypothetical protein
MLFIQAGTNPNVAAGGAANHFAAILNRKATRLGQYSKRLKRSFGILTIDCLTFTGVWDLEFGI